MNDNKEKLQETYDIEEQEKDCEQCVEKTGEGQSLEDILSELSEDYEDEDDEERIEMNLIEVIGTEYNKDEFQEGVGEASFYAGFLTAIRNAGFSSKSALEVLALHLNVDLNIEANNTSIAVAQLTDNANGKNTL